MSFWIGIVGFIIILNLIVLVHESGHFLMARRYGMKVDEFFVGFGPRIWSFRRGETEYGIKWILLGGYVKIAGMGLDEQVAAEDEDRTYASKPARQRAFTILAGPLSHFVMAFVAAWFFAAFGQQLYVLDTVEDTLNGA
ncbi:MAG: site-2 protease family protein, partial [Actinomycetota bacterium]